MSKIIPIDFLCSLHGKLNKDSEYYFQERYGVTFTGQRKKPRNLETHPYTAAELVTQQKFRRTKKAMQGLSDAEKEAYREAYGQQSAYKSLQGYIFAREYAKLQ